MTIKELALRVRPHALRALYCAFIFSFTLPYVDVMHCSTKKIATYRGYELVHGDAAFMYVIALLVFALLLALSFYKKETGRALGAFASCWRAIAAGISGLVIGLLPGIQFLFDGVYMLAGQFLGLLCACLVFIDGVAAAAAGFVSLVRQREGGAYSKSLMRFHIAAIGVSAALVPLYFVGLREDLGVAVLYLLVLSLPFVLSQCIVIEAVRRGEGWPRPWAAVVSALLVGGTVISVMSVL